MKNRYTESSWTQADQLLETTLRPQSIEDFMGQESLKERLKITLGAAKKRADVLGHVLLYGPPGLGKTTLASIIARHMEGKLTVLSGPAIEKAGDLAGILTSLETGDFLFIDEIHRMSRHIEEYLYPAMEDFVLDLTLDSGANSRSIQVKLNKFTLIGATTRAGLISAPLRSRFSMQYRLDFYDHETLTNIIIRSSSLLSSPIEKTAALEISKRSRGTPRIANNLIKWVRDYAQMKGLFNTDKQTTIEALKMLNIDEKGLDEMDKKILTTIIDHHEGGPVGVKTLGAALGEEDSTLTEVYEPYLIMQGLLRITPRGREATKLAFEHFHRPYPS